MHSHIAQWTCNPLFFSLALPRLDTTVTDREPFRFSIKFMASKSHERLPHVPAPAPLPRQLMTGNWQRGKGGQGGNGATGKVHFGVKDENRLDSNLLISFISVLCWLSFVCCLCLNPGYTHVYVRVCVRVCVCLKFCWFISCICSRYGNCGRIAVTNATAASLLLSIVELQEVAKQIRPT